MAKDYQKILNRSYILLDAITIAAAYFVAWLVLLSNKGNTALAPGIYFSALLFIIPGQLILNALFELYSQKRTVRRKRELKQILASSLLGLFIFTMILFLGSKKMVLFHFSRTLIALFYVLKVLFLTAERNIVRALIGRLRIKGINLRHILLVGYSNAAETYIDKIQDNPEWGYRVLGILDDNKDKNYDYKGINIIGTLCELHNILKENELDEIAITLSLAEYDYLGDIVDLCERSGVHTKFIPDYGKILPTIPYIENDDGVPVINIRRVPLTGLGNAFVKRTVDICGALFAIILFSPIMLITAILVKVTSRGPVIFKQERVGLHGKNFYMYKFRSMVVQTDDDEKKEWTTKNDPRVTTVGKIIRRTSIDEMPQFFNVLLGNMSLVGPRPERPFFVEKFRDEIPHYMIKHQVRPGITGWAQVNGLRGDTSISERIEYDLYYIENWTLGFDIKILFLTVFKGFINKNAY